MINEHFNWKCIRVKLPRIWYLFLENEMSDVSDIHSDTAKTGMFIKNLHYNVYYICEIFQILEL